MLLEKPLHHDETNYHTNPIQETRLSISVCYHARLCTSGHACEDLEKGRRVADSASETPGGGNLSHEEEGRGHAHAGGSGSCLFARFAFPLESKYGLEFRFLIWV